MREIVSGLTMSAIAMDPANSIQSQFAQRDVPYQEEHFAEQRLAHQAHSDVLSFSGLSNRENNSVRREFDEIRELMTDDRDLVVIEDDLETVRQGTHEAATATTSRAVLHPYAKLFTKLRNS